MNKLRINLALIGSGFMGRAHSNGFRQARSFFELPVEPVLKVLGARNPNSGAKVAEAFGWEQVVPDWREVVSDPQVQVVDIATPVHTHAEIAIAALENGKAVICEKPLAASLDDARRIAAAAERSGAPTLTTYNMRAVPAIAYARRMIAGGLLGEINQWRGSFMQSWLVDPEFPLTWRLRKETAGSGALGDLGSHTLDMARWLAGEIQSVNAMAHTFTTQRPIPLADVGRNSVPSGEYGPVSVDDAVWSLLRFSNGAYGTMEATRMATGRICANRFEVFGSRGALAFDFMRLNELQYFSLEDPLQEQGWRVIHVTTPGHPYVDGWWPRGHSLGYEHSFANLFRDFFVAYAHDESPSPDLIEGARTQAVLNAVEQSAVSRAWTEVLTL